MRSVNKSYLGVAAIGALGGGVAVALATRAIPTLATRVMPEMCGMMRKMMVEMGESGCDPALSGGCGVRHDCVESDEQAESVAATPSRCGCGAAPTAEAVPEPQVV